MINLILFSGGLDSTGMLYKLLHESNALNHVHHLTIKNAEDRWQAEDDAVEKIVRYFRKDFNFGFSNNVYEFKDVFGHRYTGLDTYTIGNDAGNVARALQYQFFNSHQEYFKVDICWATTKDDMSEEDMNTDPRWIGSNMAIASHFQDYVKEGTAIPQIVEPVTHMTKKEIWDMLPSELQEMTMSCRNPTFVNNEWVHCGMCHSCQNMFIAQGVRNAN